MSADALTAQWRWTSLKGLSGAGGYARVAYLDLFVAHLLPGTPQRIGVRSTLVGMTDYNITNWTVSLHVGGSGAGGTTSSYTVPYTGDINSAPDLSLTVTCYRSTQPAGSGKCRAALHVDVLDRGTANVAASTDLTVDASQMFVAQSVLTGLAAVAEQFLSGKASCNVILDSVSAPWPTEPVATGALIAVDGTPLSANVQTSGGETDIGINPPCDGNLRHQPRSDVQLVGRRATDADPNMGVWRRLSWGANWAEMSPTYPSTLRGGVLSIDRRGDLRLHSTRNGGSAERDLITYDQGATWLSTPASLRNLFSNPYQGVSSVWLDPLTGEAMGAGLYLNGTSDLVFVCREPTHDRVTVVSNCRTAGEVDCLPHPIVYRRTDGRWAVLWFVNDAPREYVSPDGGETWDDANPTEDWTAGAGTGYYTSFWQGLDSQQVVAGYSVTNDRLYVLSRLGPAHPWTGPHLNLAIAAAVAPYVYQRPTGAWECGWLIDGTWTRYEAGHPSGPWSEVTP